MWNKEESTVGVLMGGLSSERAISIKSGRAVLKALQERGWNAVEIDVTSQLAHTLVAHKIDVAWNALHGIYGEDGCVQGLLEVMGIPYTALPCKLCHLYGQTNHQNDASRHERQSDTRQVLKHGEEPSQDWYPCVLKDPLEDLLLVFGFAIMKTIFGTHIPKPIALFLFLKSLSKERKSRLPYSREKPILLFPYAQRRIF